MDISRAKLFAAIVLVAFSAFVSTAPLSSNPSPNELWDLGEVNGKLYFFQDDMYLNWTDAWTFCNASDMVLATIESQEEHDFFLTAFKNFTFPRVDNNFWIDGQENGGWWGADWNNETKIINVRLTWNLDWRQPPTQYTLPTDYCGMIYHGDDGRNSLTEVTSSTCGNNLDGVVCQKLSQE